MRTRSHILGFGLILCSALAACGGGGSSGTSNTGSTGAGGSSSSTATVNLVVADTPSTNLTVVSFQVQITSAVLQPGGVALLPRPVTVDLAQLVSDTGFLASTVIGSATYTSLEVTFANPVVTILNNTGMTISTAATSCAAGATCTFTPQLNEASVTISNGVFPLTVTASSTTGLNLDLSIPDLLQSDLSVTLANGSSVNLSLLSGKSSAAQQAQIADVLGTITSISGGQVNIVTAFGDSLVLTAGSSTVYNYPAGVCATSGAACLATGQIVTTDLSMLGDGALNINSISYVGAMGSQWVKGVVLSASASGTVPSAQVIIQREVNTSPVTAGEIATVSLPSGTVAYSVGTPGAPAVSGGTFASASDLLPGQELILSVGSDLVAGAAPSFTTSSVYLEPTQMIGVVGAVDVSGASLELNGLSSLFANSHPLIQQVAVQTGSATTFSGFSSASLASVTAGEFIAAKGPLFNTTGELGFPTLGALVVRARAAGN